MADSKQVDILKALTEHLEGINPDNGYNEDLRGQVFRGRLMFGPDVSPPFVTMIDAPRPNFTVEVGDSNERAENWDLLLQGWGADDSENPADPAYQLKAAVEHRLSRLFAIDERSGEPVYPDEYRLGDRVVSIKIGAGVVRPPADNPAGPLCFYLPLTIVRAADLANPFVVA